MSRRSKNTGPHELAYADPATGEVFDKDGSLLGTTSDLILTDPQWVTDDDGRVYPVVDGNVIYGDPTYPSSQTARPLGDFELEIKRRDGNFAISLVGQPGTERASLLAAASALTPETMSYSTTPAYPAVAAPAAQNVYPGETAIGGSPAQPVATSAWDKVRASRQRSKEKNGKKTLSRKLGEAGIQTLVIAAVAFPVTTSITAERKQLINFSEFPNAAAMFDDPVDGVQNLGKVGGKIVSFAKFLSKGIS